MMALVEATLSCTPWPQVSCTRPKLMTRSSHAGLRAWMKDASAKPVPSPALSISPAVMEEPGLSEPKPEFKCCPALRKSPQSLQYLWNNFFKR